MLEECSVVHCGGGWDGGQHQAHQHQEGGEYDLGVMELRKWLRERMMGNMRKVITIER